MYVYKIFDLHTYFNIHVLIYTRNQREPKNIRSENRKENNSDIEYRTNVKNA